VWAVRTYVIDESEVQMQQKFRPHAVVRNEEIFLSQLVLRASLLNDSFQSQVLDIVSRHSALGDFKSVGQPMRTTSHSSMSSSPFVRTGSSAQDTEPESSISEIVECVFTTGVAPVFVHAGPRKSLHRMREKLSKYASYSGVAHPRGGWPLAANILDPVRTSIVCEGACQIIEVAGWFLNKAEDTGMPVCRIKNKFAANYSATRSDGHRHISLNVLYTDDRGLRIIGEIQIHDINLYGIKKQMDKLSKIKHMAAP